MNDLRRVRRRRSSAIGQQRIGFTLVELLVVITIIAMLLARKRRLHESQRPIPGSLPMGGN